MKKSKMKRKYFHKHLFYKILKKLKIKVVSVDMNTIIIKKGLVLPSNFSDNDRDYDNSDYQY